MNDIATIENPLSGQVATRPGSNSPAAGKTDQQRAIAEVQAAMVIARSNPRDEKFAIDRILNACQRPRLAESAIYQYARGGTDISGPSIRLAEAIAQNWGNIQFGMRELDQRLGVSEVQAFAWDVETNVRREITFSVPHERHTRGGAKRLTDPRDIYELVANQGARRVRACILAIIPGDVIEVAVEQCEATLKAKADTSPEAIQKMVQAFQGFGIVQHQIEARIQRRLDAITPAQVVSLKKIYASLRDGMSTPVDWFEPIEDAPEEKADDASAKSSGNDAARAALEAAAAKRKPVDDKSKTLAEELDDGIPAFDGKDEKSAVDQAKEPAGVAEESVEPAAEQPQESAEEQSAEDDLAADSLSPAEQYLATLRERIEAAADKAALKKIDDDWVKNRVAYDDTVAGEIDGLVAAKRRALAGENN